MLAEFVQLFAALGTLALAADVGYIQFKNVDDLFFQYVPHPWDGVIRITALVLGTIGTMTMLIRICPGLPRQRRSGTLVASTTSAI